MSLYVYLYLSKIMSSYIQIFKTDLVKRTYNIDTKLTKAFKIKKKGGGAPLYIFRYKFICYEGSWYSKTNFCKFTM